MNAPQVPQAGASLADILTAIKNLVTAFNGLTTAYLQVNGQSTLEAITAATVVKTTPGRLASISVTTLGSTTGMAYDSNQASNTSSPLFVIPAAAGLYVVNLPTDTGLLIVPGTGQKLAVSWS